MSIQTPTNPKRIERLLTFSELPVWLKDNPSILTGYRPPLNSYSQCLKTIVPSPFHNESVNILTHLIGATIAVIVLVRSIIGGGTGDELTEQGEGGARVVKGVNAMQSSSSMEGLELGSSASNWFDLLRLIHPLPTNSNNSGVKQPFDNVTWIDTAGYVVFLLSCITCLGFSGFFHTMNCHSRDVARWMNKLDYLGIVVLIVGSFYPSVHYGFFCEPYHQAFYIFAITLLGAGATFLVLSPLYSTPLYRRTRTIVFICLGLSAIFPIFHALWLKGFEDAERAFGLGWVVTSGALYVVGAGLYAERIPEKLWPGAFDYLGSSHQIFHVFILLAALSHFIAVSKAFRFWHGEMLGICPS